MSVRTHRLFLILPVTACLHAASEEGRPDASTTTDDADVCDEEALTSFPDAAPWPDEPPEDCGSFLRETPSCFTSVLPDGIDMPSGWARIGSSAEGLWIEDEGWALLDLPDLGVPHEEMFPVDRLHSSSEKARFETGPHAFWWTGEELIPTEALEGDWLVVSGEDGVGAAKPGAMLRTSGTIRVDRALGTWKDMPTENAPVDGPVLSMALADGNNYAVAIGAADGATTILTYRGGRWSNHGEIPFPHVDDMSHDAYGHLFVAASDEDRTTGAVFEKTSSGTMGDQHYVGPPLLGIGRHWDGRLGVLTNELQTFIRVGEGWRYADTAPHRRVVDAGQGEDAYVLTPEGLWMFYCARED